MLDLKKWNEYQQLAMNYYRSAPSRMRMGGRYLTDEEIIKWAHFQAALTIFNKYGAKEFELESNYVERPE